MSCTPETITIERTRDYAAVRAIVTHPRLYRRLADDFSPAPENWEPAVDERIYYLLVRHQGNVIGAAMFHPETACCYQGHLAVLPEAWGPTSVAASRALIRWMFANSPCVRLVVHIPEENRLALRLARAAGMSRFGLNERAVSRGGRLCNLVLLGISKQEA